MIDAAEQRTSHESGTRLRIDKWLFFARIVKSRSLAAELAKAGKIRVNRNKINRASHTVRIGDVLTVSMRERILILKILDMGTRRGPATEACLLYEDISPKADVKGFDSECISEGQRPTKRERRRLDQFRDVW